MTIKIGSFNVCNFSLRLDPKKKRDDEKAAKHYAEIIRENKFDIVAIQEIRNKEALKKILIFLGGEYGGVHSSDKIFQTATVWKPLVNEYAFIWNRKRIEWIDENQYYTCLYERISRTWDSVVRVCGNEIENNQDGTDYELNINNKIVSTSLYKETSELTKTMSSDKVDLLAQMKEQIEKIKPPLICGFRPAGVWKLLPWEIRIINTHIFFGKNNDKTSKQIRKHQIGYLIGELHTLINTLRFGNFRSVFTILAGDYNLESCDIIKLQQEKDVIERCENHNMLTVQNQKTSLRDTDYKGNDPYASNYDHFSYDARGLNLSLKNVKRLDFKDFQCFRTEVSDHVPICAEIKF